MSAVAVAGGAGRVLAALLMLAATPSLAAELVMFESEGCVWCEAWDRDIGPIYAMTDEARILPLRRMDIFDPLPPALAGIAEVIYTPTFVIVSCGKEVDRIVGYLGEDQFWGLLGAAMATLETSLAAAGERPPGTC